MQSFPIKLDQEVEEAYLIRPNRSRHSLDPQPDGTLPEPSGLESGVYRLFVETDCGCFSSLIHVKCDPPAFPSESPDLEQEPVEECCE